MNAQTLYEQDRADRQTGSEDLPRQEYYHALRDALHTELVQDGRSDWLDSLLSDLDGGALTEIYLLDFAAVMACHGLIVRGQPMRDTSRHVPYARSAQGDKLAWSDMRPGGNYRMRVPPEFRQTLLDLRRTAQQLLEGPEDAVAPPPERVMQKKFEQAQILNRHLEKQNADLIAERDELRRQLGELQEGYISEQLRYAVEARRRQMEAELEKEFARERTSAKDAFRQQYARELESLEMRRFEADRSAAALLNGVKDEYRAIRADMQTQMQTLEAQIARQAETWRGSLFRQESRLLARSYVSLWELGMRSIVQLLTEAQEQASPLTPMLKKLQGDLHAQLTQQEQAMLRLGLQVEQPAPGMPFDPARHCLFGPAMGFGAAAGTPVGSCVRPGVLLLKDSGEETLVHAEVTLEKTE